MEVGLLTEIMNAFVDAFSGGFDRIRPAVSGLLHVLIGIEVVWFGMLLTLGMESVSNGLKKVMTIGMWSFVALQFDQHALALVDSLVRAGMMAAGATGSARALLNPSAILDAGFIAAEPLARQVLKGTSLLNMAATYPMFGLTWLVMMGAYTALAINAFVVMIEYYLAIAVVGILVPFGVTAPTRWIAMKPMSYFLSAGLKMMVLAFLISISRTVMQKIHFSSDEPTLREMWVSMCCTGMIGFLCWKAPDRMAQGFMSGSASLGGSDVARDTQAVGTGAVGAARLVASLPIGAVAGAAVSAGMALYARQTSGGSTGGGSKNASPSRGGSAPLATALTASASGRAGATAKPPTLVPPSNTSDTSKKE